MDAATQTRIEDIQHAIAVAVIESPVTARAGLRAADRLLGILGFLTDTNTAIMSSTGPAGFRVTTGDLIAAAVHPNGSGLTSMLTELIEAETFPGPGTIRTLVAEFDKIGVDIRNG